VRRSLPRPESSSLPAPAAAALWAGGDRAGARWGRGGWQSVGLPGRRPPQTRSALVEETPFNAARGAGGVPRAERTPGTPHRAFPHRGTRFHPTQLFQRASAALSQQSLLQTRGGLGGARGASGGEHPGSFCPAVVRWHPRTPQLVFLRPPLVPLSRGGCTALVEPVRGQEMLLTPSTG